VEEAYSAQRGYNMTADISGTPRHDAVEGRVFPIPFVWTCLFVLLAYIFGSAIYYGISKSIYSDYLDAVKNATVVCQVLSAYGRSDKFACAISGETMDTFTKNKPDDKDRTDGRHLTPSDLLLLLAEADVADMDDFENPDDILDLAVGGPAAWIASKIVGTKFGEEQPLDEIFLSGTLNGKPDGHCVQVVGTLTALQLLYGSIRTADSCKFQANSSSCLPECLFQRAADMAEMLVGRSPRLLDIGVGEKPDDSYLIIKGAMTYPWDLINATRSYRTVEPPQPANQKTSRFSELPPIPASYEVAPTNETNDKLYKERGASLDPAKLAWAQTPELLNEAVFKFSLLLVKEILRDPSVKDLRFAYQAFRGWIQQLLICISVYIFLVLAWRFLAAVLKRKCETRTVWWPVIIEGQLPSQNALRQDRVHEEMETKVRQSRALTDLIINTLPLIGLFGTVIGILFGLPNASAAVTSTGPLAGSAINALFEQLGLAFSTTAIAVIALIVFQMAWTVVQVIEDRALDKQSEFKAVKCATFNRARNFGHDFGDHDQIGVLGKAGFLFHSALSNFFRFVRGVFPRLMIRVQAWSIGMVRRNAPSLIGVMEKAKLLFLSSLSTFFRFVRDLLIRIMIMFRAGFLGIATDQQIETRRVQKGQRDFLPYKWYEFLIALALGMLTAIYYANHPIDGYTGSSYWDGVQLFLSILLFIALVVFPIRYHFRRRGFWHAARHYFMSTLTMAFVLGVVSAFHPANISGGENLTASVVSTIFFVFVLSVIAFGIYGLLHVPRMVRSFLRRRSINTPEDSC
jgi:hypothetical protein